MCSELFLSLAIKVQACLTERDGFSSRRSLISPNSSICRSRVQLAGLPALSLNWEIASVVASICQSASFLGSSVSSWNAILTGSNFMKSRATSERLRSAKTPGRNAFKRESILFDTPFLRDIRWPLLNVRRGNDLIYGPSASRGHVGERAADPLHRARINTETLGDAAHALAGALALAQGGKDALLQLGRYSEAAPIVSPHPWPAQAPRASYSGQD
jgi:hypothetical protein